MKKKKKPTQTAISNELMPAQTGKVVPAKSKPVRHLLARRVTPEQHEKEVRAVVQRACRLADGAAGERANAAAAEDRA